MISSFERRKAQAAVATKSALNLGLRLVRSLLFLARTPPRNPSRIVVHLIGNVGDVVVAIPALIALRERYPESWIGLLTSAGEREKNLAGASDLLRSARFLDSIESYATEDIRGTRRVLKLIKRVRSMRPELMVSLPPCDIPFLSVARNLVFARLTGARFCVGCDHINMHLFTFAQAQHQGVLPSEISRNFKHLRELGVNSEAIRFEFGMIDAAEERRINELLAGRRPLVALCPGGKQVGRRWPAARFIEVASRLRAEYGLNLVAVGSSRERELCEEVLEGAGGGLNLAGELSLRGTTHLLSKVQFLLTNDTGPMHLAAAVGTKVVAIFGTRDFAGRWLPFGEGHEVFRAVLNCGQCLFADDESDHCVKKITVEDVYAGCSRLLERLNYRQQEESSETSSGRPTAEEKELERSVAVSAIR